jgi:hypothetical protein
MANAPVVFAPCRCGSGDCAHHLGEQCPNPMIPPVSVMLDGVTKEVIPESASGMCQPCWDNYHRQLLPWLEEENVLKQLLLPDTELEMVEPSKSYGDRIERMYPLQWKQPKDGEAARVWLHGCAQAIKEPADFEEHFKKQITLVKQRRG